MDEVLPLYAQTFISCSRSGEFNQILNYMYYDEHEYYASLVHKESEYKREMYTLWNNMQAFLDEEIVKINNNRVFPKVRYISLDFIGSKTLPMITWIISYKGKIDDKQQNVYECWSDEEIAEYDFESRWCFPLNTKIVEVETPLNFDIQRNILTAWGRRGDKVGGYEKILFRL